jgi:hypothetical protein
MVAARAHPEAPLFAFRVSGRALDFYAGRVARTTREPEPIVAAAAAETVWVYTNPARARELAARGLEGRIEIEGRFEGFPVSRLTIEFLDPATRADAVSERVLLRVVPPESGPAGASAQPATAPGSDQESSSGM